ncbi:hypothetical protein IFM46972_11558 [Aspergillus udagawae]|uniref:Uncharacterized protein n=1 Tax=Aspergillus udagawae TaxID=91492 RepID=A0A8E0V4G3_9EURO|nr:uncharacterized protein Aud_002052 [Aspergillus udagawae]GFF60250.1 hypothetical protein IFM46972_11558 [Aspergillus udagawae]GIC94723.1 hypothetical protein Aud_002052 [Aspergillus udagawae]
MGEAKDFRPNDEDPPCKKLESRHKDVYDETVAVELINASHVLQFTFQQQGKTYPYVIYLPGRMAESIKPPRPEDPTKPDPETVLYAKGWLPCDFQAALRKPEGLPVTVSTAKTESIYCARSTFGHGLTWRSTVINGTAHALDWEKSGMDPNEPVTDDDIKTNEKLWGLNKIVNGFIPDQWENTRSPIKREVDMVLVLRVNINKDESHVRVRHGFNRWEVGWEKSKPDEYWQGTIPVWETYGDPFYGNTEAEYPLRVKRFFEQQSRKNKAYAIAQAGRDSFPYAF